MKKLWDAWMLWVLVGLVLLVSGLLLPEWMDLSKSVGGVLLGVGVSLMVYGICRCSQEKLEKEQLEKHRQEVIEYEDERIRRSVTRPRPAWEILFSGLLWGLLI